MRPTPRASSFQTFAGLPDANTSTSIDGGASAVSNYDFDNSGFDITFSHSRVDTYFSQGWSYGYTYFSVDQNVDYVASGWYTAVDPDGDGRAVYFRSFLEDMTTASRVFDSLQSSESTPNESFTLGLSEGDDNNIDLGSLAGTLIAGREYQFYYTAYIQTVNPPNASSATGSGGISLSFVPEPGAGLLLTTAILGVALRRRRSV